MTSTDLQALDQSIKNAKEHIEIANALERLQKNRDFKKVILDGYLTDNAVRLVHLKADSNMQSPESQQEINNQINGIGQLLGYFTTIKQLAEVAHRSLEADEQTREELLQEGI